MNIQVYVRQAYCPYCDKAKELLADNNMPFEVIVLDTEELKEDIKARSGMRTVPIIYIDGRLVGGYDQLKEYVNGN